MSDEARVFHGTTDDLVRDAVDRALDEGVSFHLDSGKRSLFEVQDVADRHLAERGALGSVRVRPEGRGFMIEPVEPIGR